MPLLKNPGYPKPVAVTAEEISARFKARKNPGEPVKPASIAGAAVAKVSQGARAAAEVARRITSRKK